MKSLVRWSATLGLVGTTLLGSLFGGNMRALALTEQQVIEKLRTVPVFMIARADGIPLHRCVAPDTGQPIGCDAQNSVVVTPFFLSPQDAQVLLNELKTQQPEAGSNLQIVPRSLGFVYQRLEEANQDQQQRLVVDLEPRQQQVNSAINLLQQEGQQIQQFNGVPLFFAVATVGEDQVYLPGQNGNQEVIPFFFDKDQLQRNLDQLIAEKPEAASQIEIKVITLEGLISELKNSDDPVLEKFFLEPSPEAIQFLQSRPSSRPSN
ncbi:MAG: Tic22 family protein [Coleofasciculus sp. G1-WW12-02]|uniref:Tic22 family protein n=1 Tax=unclassified Coleofasciculus TaxID=2692782 RepID=UPI0032FB387B